MKTIFYTLLSLMIITSCGTDSAEGIETSTTEEATLPETQKSPEKIEDFDCATFFKKGDYSSVCFIHRFKIT